MCYRYCFALLIPGQLIALLFDFFAAQPSMNARLHFEYCIDRCSRIFAFAFVCHQLRLLRASSVLLYLYRLLSYLSLMLCSYGLCYVYSTLLVSFLLTMITSSPRSSRTRRLRIDSQTCMHVYHHPPVHCNALTLIAHCPLASLRAYTIDLSYDGRSLLRAWTPCCCTCTTTATTFLEA